MRMIDLSVPISNRQKELGSKPGGIPEIEYFDHKQGAATMKQIFQCKDEDFPVHGEGWAVEEIFLTAHTGTHMDAPWHFGAISEGKPAATIDQMPLEYGYSNGVVLNFSDFAEKHNTLKIGVADLQAELNRIGYQLQPLDIVLIYTGWDKKWGTSEYDKGPQPGMTRESTLWLIEAGVRLVGTDGFGWDADFDTMRNEYIATGNKDGLWEGHFAGLTRSYYQMEKLTNLNLLPSYGFKLSCFPIKIEKASAGWVRAVAILDE